MFSPLTEPLHELAKAWSSVTRSSRSRSALAGLGFVWVLALLAARHGTPRARLAAACAIAASIGVAVAWRWAERRRLRAPDVLLRGLARRVDRARADRALRALSLFGATGEAAAGVSQELAHLHVARALAELPSDRILARASRVAGRVSTVAIIVAVSAVALAVANAWSVLEGGDILVAHRGVAPVSMQWLDGLELGARPPDYLHESEIHESAFSPLALPFGTQLTLRGAPLHTGRRLLLSDGTVEVPFVEDGAGAVVARWSLTYSATLHVVARFGDVVIPDPGALPLVSIPDQTPVVHLETAPRQVHLVDESEDLPIRYQASDDHGLREVHLVLRSGAREERRVLAHLDGETKTDSGGRALRLRDPFLKRSHAPVEITVEAKDNDPLNGPKWGASEAVTVIPPDVGEPEAKRLEALRRLRDQLVDALAWRLHSAEDNGVHGAPGAAARAAHLADENKRTLEDERLVDEVLSGTYAGVRVPSRTSAMLLAQQHKLRLAVDAEARGPAAARHSAAVAATERFVLVADAVVRGLGVRDTRDAAKELADVADDLAVGANQMQADAADMRARGAVRMDAATLVLRAGGSAMERLGALGRDLGEIVSADCARVTRARAVPDLFHAELAARDLAARMRQPDPSFGSRGSGDRAGGESGGARGTPGDEGEPPDDVEQAFNEAANDLDRLAQEHAGAMGRVEQALAGSEDDRGQSEDESRRHAQQIRDAARPLPSVGTGGDSWSSKGAAARELAEQAARSLEEGRPEDAAQAGRSAVGALDEAKRLLRSGDQGRGWIAALQDPDGDGEKQVDDARRKLDGEVRWAEEQLKRMRKAAAQRARGQLERSGDEEDEMANRAREIGQRGRDKGSLPQQAIESIDDAERAARQAAQALRQGDVDKGLDRQHEAQRDLEAAREQLQGEPDEGEQHAQSSKDDGTRAPSNRPVDIPKDHKGPEEFRRRVVRGLGQGSTGSLRDAVQRYAEGLLR